MTQVAGFPITTAEGIGSITSGLLANRPAPGVTGRFWYSTDDGLLQWDDGTAWLNVGQEPLISLVNCGADSSGVLDSTVALGIALSVSASFGGVYVPAGTYKLLAFAGLDWSVWLPAQSFFQWKFICEPGVVWKGPQYIRPQSGFQFFDCMFVLGQSDGSASPNNTSNFNLSYINDSYIEILDSRNAPGTGNGVHIDQTSGSTAHIGFFNNRIRCFHLGASNGGNGLLAESDTSVYGIQGNDFLIQHAQANTGNGVQIDTATGHSTKLNNFNVMSEHNSGAGILDYNGQNTYTIRNTNSNTNGGFVLASGAGNVPIIIGNLTDGSNLNNGKAVFLNATGVAAPSVEALQTGGNSVTVASTAAGTDPTITVSGDTNRNLSIVPAGTGGMLISAAGSGSSSPTPLGFSTGSGQYSRVQISDNSNAWQSGNNQRQQMYAYWGLEIHGFRQSVGGPSMVAGTAGDDAVGLYNGTEANPGFALRANGHCRTASSTVPTVAIGANGQGLPSIAGSDMEGVVTAETANSLSAGGTLVTVTFGAAFSNAPDGVILTTVGTTEGRFQCGTVGTGSFTIAIAATADASVTTTYKIAYRVVTHQS